MDQRTTRFIDFWLLGGASIAIWVACAIAQYFRQDYYFVEQRMQQIAPTFLFLSLLINYPHFMSSYRMAYTQNRSFYSKNWSVLIATPLLLVGLFVFAYQNLSNTNFDTAWIMNANKLFMFIGLGYRLGESPSIGIDLLGVAAWLMFFTVGWHYSKQVFGCLMVYANYDSYPISRTQRKFLKFSVFSVAFYSFCYLNFHWRNFSMFGGVYNLMGLPITELGLPQAMETIAKLLVVVGLVLLVYGVFYQNFKRARQLPSLNFLAPILAFYIWWIPAFPQAEFYLMLVPFFHSLQYLVFAFRVEKSEVKKMSSPIFYISIRTMVLILVGFLAFEVVPGVFDLRLGSQIGVGIFFTLAATVFINVHHFFLDSVLWRFQNPNIRAVLLSPGDARRSK